MPERIQRKRTKGWEMPAGAVYVGRPTQWGNPFAPDWESLIPAWLIFGRSDADPVYITPQSSLQAVALYRVYLLAMIQDAADEGKDLLAALRGKDLACWCPLDQPCHADVLLEFANRPSKQ